MSRLRTGCVTYNQERKAWVARLDWSDETGHRRCRKKQVKTRTDGANLVKKWIRDLERHGSAGIDGDRMRFDQLAKIYEDRRLQAPVYRQDRKVSGLRSWRVLRGYLKTLRAYFGRQPLRTIGYYDLEKFKLDRLKVPVMRIKKGKRVVIRNERSLAHVHRELSLLRQMFAFAEKEGLIVLSPFKRGAPLISPADETRRERILTRDEERRLLAVCIGPRKHLRPILYLALDCGLRRGELLQLRWSDVDLESRELRLRSTITKTARSRTVGLSDRVYRELQALWDAGPGRIDMSVFGLGEFKQALKTACEMAEIRNFRFHDCRHTAITRWIQQGLSVGEAMKLAGHTTLAMHASYTNIDQETARRGAQAMDEYHEEETNDLLN